MEEELQHDEGFEIIPWYAGRIGLDAFEGALLIRICYRGKGDEECSESNSRLAHMFSTYPAKISKMLSHLEKLGYIERETSRVHGAILKRKLRVTAKGRAALDWLADNCDPEGPEVGFEYIEPQEDANE